MTTNLFFKEFATISPFQILCKKYLVSECDGNNNQVAEFIPFQRQTEKYFLSPTIQSLPSSYSTTAVNDGFVIYYETKTRNPLCVVEKLTRRPTKDDHLKRPPFYSEPKLESSYFRVNPNEYINSKYDRGHMVAAADFSFDPNLYKETFTMCNISPQAPSLNKGFWARFEAWIRNFLLQHIFEEMIVFTGPVFAPTFINNQWVQVNKTIGTFPRLVAVPTHFFKIIVGKHKYKNDTQVVIGAFLVPNVDTIDKMEPLSNFLVRLDQLENIIGFQILPSFFDSKQIAQVDSYVPMSRDLANVLSASNMTKSDGPVTYDDIGSPTITHNKFTICARESSSNIVKKFESEDESLNNHNKKAMMIRKESKMKITHFCQCGAFDCAKSLFEK